MGNNLTQKERGNTKSGCLLLLFLLAIFGYLCYRIVPVYLEKEAFQEGLLTIAGRATLRRWNDHTIIQEVIKLSNRTQFDLQRENIQIKRVQGRPEIFLVVNYSRTEEFPGGDLYVFHFRYVAQGSIGI
ncbi:MAG: hypothetical protein ACE5MK_08970 [Acidobacteriota bacterium]